MPDLRGPTATKESPTSKGSILTVVRDHGTYTLIREGGRITSASYVKGSNESKKVKELVKDYKSKTEQKAVEKKKGMWSKAGWWASAITNPSKVKSFLKATSSRALQGPVSLAVLDHRHQCCHGKTLDGENVSAPCRARVSEGDGFFCKSCGCGEWKLADLTVPPTEEQGRFSCKLAFPDLTCPLGKWTAMKGIRAEQ